MTTENRKDARFYVTLSLGYILLLLGCLLPPLGVISNSVLVGAGMLICLAGLILGLDIPALLREIRLLKQDII